MAKEDQGAVVARPSTRIGCKGSDGARESKIDSCALALRVVDGQLACNVRELYHVERHNRVSLPLDVSLPHGLDVPQTCA